MKRKHAIATLYVLLTFTLMSLSAFIQENPFLRASMLVISGAAYMFLTIGIVTYCTIFPEIPLEGDQTEELPGSFEGVMKVLREDEKKVCMAVWDEGGTAMQNDVRWTTGLSKVRTHRVVAGLASRGVIKVTKEGRRNRLSLASWLHKED